DINRHGQTEPRRELSSDLLNSPSMPTTPTGGSAKAAGYDLYSHCENRHPRMAPRSGLAAKNFIDVETGVVLFNFVAQLVCERICNPDLVEQETLDETERGAGGFGSIGSN
uniref:Deoxyuridine 5'-triphosphate nucleotidohydrolase n=1 Tax=Mola mola TaxID=94237 RepID=A0A3Q3VKT4_MOLML